MPKKLLEIAADIVQTQAGKSQLSSEEIVSSLKEVFGVLQELGKVEAGGSLVETVNEPQAAAPVKTDPKDSIKDDKIVCLECGAEMRQLTIRHLSSHGLDLRQYRKKYGLPLKLSLSAKALTKQRSKLAKKRGLPENLKKYIAEQRRLKGEAAAPEVVPEEVKETASPAKRTRAKK